MLTKKDLRKIVDIQLNYLKERMNARKIELEFTDNARQQIMDEGYDPAFGARPLKRTIQQRLETLSQQNFWPANLPRAIR